MFVLVDRAVFSTEKLAIIAGTPRVGHAWGYSSKANVHLFSHDSVPGERCTGYVNTASLARSLGNTIGEGEG